MIAKHLLRSARPAGLLLLVGAVLVFSGCHVTSGSIRRSIELTSEPTGAYVTVDGESYGRTPVSVPFLWYWYHDVELKKDGYYPLSVRERLKSPPHFYIPLDFFFEIQPFLIHDRRYRHYFMEPISDI